MPPEANHVRANARRVAPTRRSSFPFDRLGPRVPAVVVSPWIRRGVIDHTTYDHTSILATVERLLGLNNLTKRDKAANDLLHLLTPDTPRTDAPAAMPSPAVNPNPLNCEGDSEDVLLKRRSELREAQRSGRFRERRTADVPATSTQIGFAQVALMRVLLTAKYPERERWIDQYEAIQTGVDASLFMTEARLQVSHDIDFSSVTSATIFSGLPDGGRRGGRPRSRATCGTDRNDGFNEAVALAGVVRRCR